MKVQIKILMATAIFFAIPSLSQESHIAFHIDCPSISTECVELQFQTEPNQKIIVKKNPEMTIGQADLNNAETRTSEYDQEEFVIHLKKEPTEKFAQITKENIGKKLAIVIGGKVLTAPTVYQSITEGIFVITAGMGNKHKYIDSVPWLKEMTENKKISEENWKLFSIACYSLLGLVILGGSIYFAFYRKRRVA